VGAKQSMIQLMGGGAKERMKNIYSAGVTGAMIRRNSQGIQILKRFYQ